MADVLLAHAVQVQILARKIRNKAAGTIGTYFLADCCTYLQAAADHELIIIKR